MLSFRDLPIRNKLLLIIIVASVIALAVAASAVIVYESTTFRPRALDNLTTIVSLYSLDMPAPLHFNDPEAATEDLATLRKMSDIRIACVYTASGKIFAMYDRAVKPGATKIPIGNCPPPIRNQGIRFEQDLVSLLQPIMQGDEVAGYFYLVADLPPLYARLPQYGIMVGVVILSLLVVALLLSGAIKRYITMPVVNLATTAHQISRDKDYSVRGAKRQNDEVGALTDAFNQMLEAIEQGQAVRKRNEEERSRLIEQLKEAVRSRDEFISIASHELRTPLTPLKLQLQIVQRIIESEAFRDNPKTSLLREVIEPADRQIERLAKLVDNLLNVSHITTGMLRLNLEKMDLAEFLSDILNQYRPEIIKAGCSLELDNDTPIIGYWDRLRIEQVMINLLTNAMKYGMNKPIVISLTADNDMARLTVRDFGIGVAPEDQQRIFERFERAASSRSYGGLGLGLYITRQIVEAHGGEINVHSEPGRGTVFTVLLPIRNSA